MKLPHLQYNTDRLLCIVFGQKYTQYSIAKNSQIFIPSGQKLSGQVDTGTYPIDANGVPGSNITAYQLK